MGIGSELVNSDLKLEEKAIIEILKQSGRQSMIISCIALIIACGTGAISAYYMHQDQSSDKLWQSEQVASLQ
jgi:hypothetical protein